MADVNMIPVVQATVATAPTTTSSTVSVESRSTVSTPVPEPLIALPAPVIHDFMRLLATAQEHLFQPWINGIVCERDVLAQRLKAVQEELDAVRKQQQQLAECVQRFVTLPAPRPNL